MALYFSVTIPDPMQQATPHSSLPTSMSQILLWPSMSPDLNKETHTWQELERCVQGRKNTPANILEPFQTLKQGWVAIPAQLIYNLIQSMPERCWSVFDSRGWHTPYWCAHHWAGNTRWLNFLLDEKSVKIMNFDLSPLQNEIGWTQFLTEFSKNNYIWKQTKCVFLFSFF